MPNTKTDADAAPQEQATKQTRRRFVFNGGELPDPGGAMTAEQVRDVWAGTYPDLQNAKVKGPDKSTDPDGTEVLTYTFAQNVGRLG